MSTQIEKKPFVNIPETLSAEAAEFWVGGHRGHIAPSGSAVKPVTMRAGSQELASSMCCVINVQIADAIG